VRSCTALDSAMHAASPVSRSHRSPLTTTTIAAAAAAAADAGMWASLLRSWWVSTRLVWLC
jgi:hypothetical protein